MGLDLVLIWKERWQQKWGFEKYLKAAEVAPARKRPLRTVKGVFIEVLDD